MPCGSGRSEDEVRRTLVRELLDTDERIGAVASGVDRDAGGVGSYRGRNADRILEAVDGCEDVGLRGTRGEGELLNALGTSDFERNFARSTVGEVGTRRQEHSAGLRRLEHRDGDRAGRTVGCEPWQR